jgi:hypothetical protein
MTKLRRLRFGLGTLAVVSLTAGTADFGSQIVWASDGEAGQCQMSPADEAWIEQALQARRFMSRQIGSSAFNSTGTLILFDARCVVTGTGALADGQVTWMSERHDGEVVLPGGAKLPADVTSFAGENEGTAFFVMSTPSLWRAKGVPAGAIGLEKLMTGVFLHESAHVAQFSTYMRQVGEIAERENLPQEFGDDSIQERFRDNPDFAGSVARETELLYAAAAARKDADARRLAEEATTLIKARRERWFTGPDAFLGQTEDLFLSLEGSGQWVAYRWLTDKQGGAMTPASAISEFGRRGGWWTQDEGLALVLATERLGGKDWRACAFGKGSVAGVPLLDQAISASREAASRGIAISC